LEEVNNDENGGKNGGTAQHEGKTADESKAATGDADKK
jgi:hypothetical protein